MSLIPVPSDNTPLDWDELLSQLKEIPPDVAYPEKFKEMIYEVIKVAKESKSLHDLNILLSTMKELRKANHLFTPYRDVRKVCIFGSARTPESNPHYSMAQEFSSQITHKGYMVITGAGPGIMEAGNRGAIADMSFGVNIKLPFEQSANPYIAHSSKLISFKYFFNRKLSFIKESDATVLFPGGFGTHDEGFELLTLIQTGRCAPRPLILMESPGSTYWKTWVTFIRKELLDNHYISEEDMFIISTPTKVEEAVSVIENFYKNYHSVRYVGHLAFIRLNKRLTEAQLNDITKRFSDLATDGHYHMYDPQEAEGDSEDYPDQYRLVCHFDKVRYGRLYQLILALNTF